MQEIRIGRYILRLEVTTENAPNQDKTKAFLCELSNLYFEGREYARNRGFQGTARDYLNKAIDIHSYLESIKYFDDIKAKVNECTGEPEQW